MVQWLRLYLAMQGTQAQSLVRELRPSHASEQLSLSTMTRERVCTAVKHLTCCN